MDKEFKKYTATLGNRSFTIEEDLPKVGWYLYVFENGKCVADHLQDHFEIVINFAQREYGVPKEAWKQMQV